MGMTKGGKHYPNSFKAKIVEEQRAGSSVKGLSKKYGVSRYAIQCWCGLCPEKEKIHDAKRRGRPRKTPLPIQKELELKIKELERENDLLKSFLQTVGRM